MTLWEGRISTGMADAVADFTVSLPFDRVLAHDDLVGSRAHVKGLGKAGILSDSEVGALIDALDLVEEEFSTGVFVYAPRGAAEGQRPVTVLLHGLCGHPESACGPFVDVSTERGWLVCPRGEDPCGAGKPT